MCQSFLFFCDVLLLFTTSMIVVYCSSVNYALVVSSLPFLLDLIFFSLKFLESFENMYDYIIDKLNTHQIHLSNF